MKVTTAVAVAAAAVAVSSTGPVDGAPLGWGISKAVTNRFGRGREPAPPVGPSLSRQSSTASEYMTPPGSPMRSTARQRPVAPTTELRSAPPVALAPTSPGKTTGASGAGDKKKKKKKEEKEKKPMTEEDKYDIVSAVSGTLAGGITVAAFGLNAHIAEQNAIAAAQAAAKNGTAATKRSPEPMPAPISLQALMGNVERPWNRPARASTSRAARPAPPVMPAGPVRQDSFGSEASVNGPVRSASSASLPASAPHSPPGSPARTGSASPAKKDDAKKDEEEEEEDPEKGKAKLSTKLGAYASSVGLLASIGYLGVAIANQDTQNKKDAAKATVQPLPGKLGRREYEEHSPTRILDTSHLASFTPLEIIQGSLGPATGKHQGWGVPHHGDDQKPSPSPGGVDPARIVQTNTFFPHRRDDGELETHTYTFTVPSVPYAGGMYMDRILRTNTANPHGKREGNSQFDILHGDESRYVLPGKHTDVDLDTARLLLPNTANPHGKRQVGPNDMLPRLFLPTTAPGNDGVRQAGQPWGQAPAQPNDGVRQAGQPFGQPPSPVNDGVRQPGNPFSPAPARPNDGDRQAGHRFGQAPAHPNDRGRQTEHNAGQAPAPVNEGLRKVGHTIDKATDATKDAFHSVTNAFKSGFDSDKKERRDAGEDFDWGMRLEPAETDKHGKDDRYAVDTKEVRWPASKEPAKEPAKDDNGGDLKPTHHPSGRIAAWAAQAHGDGVTGHHRPDPDDPRTTGAYGVDEMPRIVHSPTFNLHTPILPKRGEADLGIPTTRMPTHRVTEFAAYNGHPDVDDPRTTGAYALDRMVNLPILPKRSEDNGFAHRRPFRFDEPYHNGVEGALQRPLPSERVGSGMLPPFGVIGLRDVSPEDVPAAATASFAGDMLDASGHVVGRRASEHDAKTASSDGDDDLSRRNSGDGYRSSESFYRAEWLRPAFNKGYHLDGDSNLVRSYHSALQDLTARDALSDAAAADIAHQIVRRVLAGHYGQEAAVLLGRELGHGHENAEAQYGA